MTIRDRFGADNDTIGFDLDFVTDNPIVNTAKDAVHTLGDVAKAIPGGNWILDGAGKVTGTVGDFVNGPLRDFARTGTGETIFRAFSVALSISAYATPYIGYMLGFLAWSIPGLAKGDRIDKALVDEFVYRVQYVASVFAGKAGESVAKGIGDKVSAQMSDQLRKAIEDLNAQAKEKGFSLQEFMNRTGISSEQLAAKLGIREDVAAYAIQWARHKTEAEIQNIKNMYSAETGKKKMANIKVGKGSRKSLGKVHIDRRNPCEKVEDAKRNKQPPSIIASLQKQCDEFLAKSQAVPVTTNTIAAAAALQANPDHTELQATGQSSEASKSNRKSLLAGLGAGLLGAGGALVAGLTATVAIPVGLGFGAGVAGVTKILDARKKQQTSG